MANIKWTSTLYSTFGTQYRVDIHDTSFSGASTVISLMHPGFQLSFMEPSDERFDPIKGSKCEVYLNVSNDTTGAALQTWLYSTMLATTEDKYQIAIYEAGDLIWFGNVLPDLNERQDASRPYQFTLTATDGIARLKDFDFDLGMGSAGANWGSDETFISIIYACLKKTPLYIARGYLGNTILFQTSVDWYENQMDARTASNDPLNMAKVNTFTFKPATQDESDRVPMSCYEVLDYVCRAWGMRLIMSGGIFRFIQLGQYEDTTICYLRQYEITTGNYDSFIALPAEVALNVSATSRPRVMSGNVWSYFAPLKTVSLKFQFGDNPNMLNSLDTLDYSTTIPDNLVGGANIRLNFSTVLNFIDLNLGTFSYPLVCVVNLTISIGSGTWYLKKSVFSNTLTWDASPSVCSILVSITAPRQNLPINISTIDIPSGTFDTNNFALENVGVTDNVGSPLTVNTDYVLKRQLNSTSLKYNTSSGNQESNYYLYIARNGSSYVNSLDLDLPDSIMGEMYQPNFFGGLLTGPSTGSFEPSTSQWRLYDTGTYQNFNMQLVKEVLSGQIFPVERYQGAIVGKDIKPDSCFGYNSQTYILNGATFSAATEMWEGEWFRILFTRASFESIQNATSETGDNTGDNLMGITGGLQYGLSNEIITKGSYYTISSTGDTTGGSNSCIFTMLGANNFTPAPASDLNPTGNLSAVQTVVNNAGAGDVVTIIATIGGTTNPTIAQYESLTFYSPEGSTYLIK